jgi:cathepsin F
VFTEFTKQYQRSYAEGSAEYLYREKLFNENLMRLKEEQENSPTSVHTVNRFSDLTRDEFMKGYTGYKPLSPSDITRICLSGTVPPLMDTENLPPSFDWRTHSPPVVTPVKDQGGCGSCWTFSSIGNIEGQYALKGNPLTSFSEQSIVDCSKGCITHMGSHVCNQGCGGGWQFVAFSDMIPLGIPTEASYPYIGRDGKCKLPGTIKSVATIVNYTCITPPDGTGADEDQMAAWLVANGPMAFAMDVSTLGSYSHGVFNPKRCNTTALDHALVIVGYGTDTGLDYWIIKNSWGAGWGEKGYLRLVKGRAACGVNNAVSSAVLG